MGGTFGPLLLIGSMLLLVVLGVPIAYAIGIASLITALVIGIPLEAILLKVSDGFANRLAALAMLVAYGFSFYFLSLSLRVIPVGLAYAVWSGIGIVIISVIGWLAFDQRLSLPAIAGIGLIVVGVAVVQLATAEST